MALFGLLGGKKTSVGLDIGSGIIKLAVIDHSGSEPELAKVATTEVAADAIVEGEVMDPGLVSEAIRGLFSTAGVKQRSVVTARSEEHTSELQSLAYLVCRLLLEKKKKR